MILAVAYIDVAIAVGCYVVDDVELAGVGSRAAPRLDVLPIRTVLMHISVTVAIGNEQVAVDRVCGDVSASVERLAAVRLGWLARDAYGHQYFAVQRALTDGVVAVVGAVQRVVGTHADAMRASEDSLAPGLDESCHPYRRRPSDGRLG